MAFLKQTKFDKLTYDFRANSKALSYDLNVILTFHFDSKNTSNSNVNRPYII